MSPARDRLLALVRERPGACVEDLAKLVGLTRTTTQHHLGKLVRGGQIERVRQGRRVLHFPPDVRGGVHRTVLGAMRLHTARQVMEAVHREPGISWRRLARMLDVTPKAVRWHVQRLREQGMLDVQEAHGGPRHIVVLRDELREALGPAKLA